MIFLLRDSPQKLKLKVIHVTLIILFYLGPSSPQLQGVFFFLLKTQKSFSASESWGSTKSSFKENARFFSKNTTTQENTQIIRLKKDCKTYTEKKTSKQKLNQ